MLTRSSATPMHDFEYRPCPGRGASLPLTLTKGGGSVPPQKASQAVFGLPPFVQQRAVTATMQVWTFE